MQVARLRLPLARLGAVGNRVALDQRDAVKVVAQDTGGQQAGHTGAEDDGVRIG